MKNFSYIFLYTALYCTIGAAQDISPVSIGTPYAPNATKVMMLGAGELGKECVIELQRLGIEVIAVDRYDHAPAMQVAHRSYTISMLDAQALREVIEQEQPDYIVPEIEALATQTLQELEQEGYRVIPNARAVQLTMNREGIRRLAAEELKVKTSRYLFAENLDACTAAADSIGFPCVIKPIMSSSGKGQSVVVSAEQLEAAWNYAQEGARGTKGGKVIIEEYINFDDEITLLTIRTQNGTLFCAPIGHRHEHGEYVESWQPHELRVDVLERAQEVARCVTDALGGVGVFGVELFIKDNDIYFSEVSPRPHDTGMVTLISQNLSEFALHARAILGLPIPEIELYGPSASQVILVDGNSKQPLFNNIACALAQPQTQVRLFGKPEVMGHRRMGVALARGNTIAEARQKAAHVTTTINVKL